MHEVFPEAVELLKRTSYPGIGSMTKLRSYLANVGEAFLILRLWRFPAGGSPEAQVR
ncbi:MAG: hypothetical protein HY666_02585 [Chloroflexi bacterium]|nr:hypothetical protein [Chloroflexota bacterium]